MREREGKRNRAIHTEKERDNCILNGILCAEQLIKSNFYNQTAKEMENREKGSETKLFIQ